jgi:hypothetical protein
MKRLQNVLFVSKNLVHGHSEDIIAEYAGRLSARTAKQGVLPKLASMSHVVRIPRRRRHFGASTLTACSTVK